MAKRPSLEERLAEIRLLRNREPSPELTASLKTAIADRSNLIAATAAEIAGERGLAELAAPLEAAFARFLVDPVRTDKLCRAKLAIVKALDGMEHDAEETFRKSATHVQQEPVWGGTEDTAAPLRAAALLALTRVNPLDLMTILVEALVDPEKEVRGAAAQALGAVGSQAAALLLRLKIRLGDREPEVLSDCLSGMLAADLPAGLELARERLRSNDVPTGEAAAMALARSRRPEAFDALRECWERPILPLPLKEAVLLAMGMLRLPAPTDFLLRVVAEEPPQVASLALAALKIQAHDSRLRDRLAEIMAERKSPELTSRFARDFPG
ncbi:HEAT repeat domain-containing protein [Aquisphaera insulae]|uniref:HEAT repeat domain-containing protein n=1 Tax=Aquisphaera insulae TaxID=2712864 RepID=UPI0013EAE8EB|nr:HEAT repeat domain-containing protein [Aquisphaera insulae]